MALLHLDGMDAYGDWADVAEAGYSRSSTSSVAPDISGGRYGEGSIKCNWTADLIKPVIGMVGNNLLLQAAFKHESLVDATDEQLIEVYNNSGVDLCFKLAVMPTGALRLRDSTGAIVVTSDPGVVNEGTWHYIEIDAVIAGAGSVVVRMGGLTGVEVINEAAVDTSISATDVDLIYFAGASDASDKGVWWDDILIMDDDGSYMNALQGDCRVFSRRADATTATDDWSKSAAVDSNLLVDDPIPEGHDGDATYVYDPTTSNDEVLWLYEDVPVDYAVKAVGMAIVGRKTDSGPGQIQARAYGLSTDHYGSIFQLSTDYQLFRSFMERAADGSEWSAAKVNATSFGVTTYSPV